MPGTYAARDGAIYAQNALRTDRFFIRGASWFGAEGSGACPDGLWQRPASELLDFMQSEGFNALRLPLAVDNVLSDPEVGKWSLTANPEWRGLRSLDVLDRIVQLAASRGLLVMRKHPPRAIEATPQTQSWPWRTDPTRLAFASRGSRRAPTASRRVADCTRRMVR